MKTVFFIIYLVCLVLMTGITVVCVYRLLLKLVNAIKTKKVKVIAFNILVTVILLGLWVLIIVSMHPFSVLSRVIQNLQ